MSRTTGGCSGHIGEAEVAGSVTVGEPPARASHPPHGTPLWAALAPHMSQPSSLESPVSIE